MAHDANWIIVKLMPYEPEVRRWLRRASGSNYDESDIIQEAYYRMWRSADAARIHSPRAYFFQVARNIVLEQLRRDRIVKFSTLTEVDAQFIPHDEPGADRIVASRSRLETVRKILEELPGRCGRILRLRKIEGASQRETAELLGVTENVVEKDIALATRYVLRRLGELDGVVDEPNVSTKGAERARRKQYR